MPALPSLDGAGLFQLGQGKILYRFAGPLVGDDYRQRFLPELEKARAVE